MSTASPPCFCIRLYLCCRFNRQLQSQLILVVAMNVDNFFSQNDNKAHRDNDNNRLTPDTNLCARLVVAVTSSTTNRTASTTRIWLLSMTTCSRLLFQNRTRTTKRHGQQRFTVVDHVLSTYRQLICCTCAADMSTSQPRDTYRFRR